MLLFLTTATKRERRRDTFSSFSFSVLCRSCFSSARHIHHGRQGNCRCRSRQAADWRLARPIWEALRTHQCLLAEVMQFARGLRSSIFSFLEVEKRHSRKATTATREKKLIFPIRTFVCQVTSALLLLLPQNSSSTIAMPRSLAAPRRKGDLKFETGGDKLSFPAYTLYPLEQWSFFSNAGGGFRAPPLGVSRFCQRNQKKSSSSIFEAEEERHEGESAAGPQRASKLLR